MYAFIDCKILHYLTDINPLALKVSKNDEG